MANGQLRRQACGTRRAGRQAKHFVQVYRLAALLWMIFLFLRIQTSVFPPLLEMLFKSLAMSLVLDLIDCSVSGGYECRIGVVV